MGFLKEKYTKEYFLNIDEHGNNLDYGALGGKDFLNGDIYSDIVDSLNLIDDIQNKNILEIGFGRGESIKYFYNRNAKSYYGIDFSPASLEITNKYIMPDIHSEKYEIHCDDALAHIKSNLKKIKERKINCIIMLDVIEHIPKDEVLEILNLLNKITSKNCLFCVHTPFYEIDEDYVKNKKYINPSQSDLNPKTKGMHCNKFTSKRFFDTLEKFNFYLYKSDRLFIKKTDGKRNMTKFLQNIIPVKDFENNIRKLGLILCLQFNLRLRIKKVKSVKSQKSQDRYVKFNKLCLRVKEHWFWDEYEKTGWEPQTYNTYKRFLNKKSTYVDVGAWVGTTIFFACELGVKNIYAIEANPLSYEMVKENCKMNKISQKVCIDNLCITDKNNITVGFGGINNEINTSSASSIRGDKWQIPSKKLITYLKDYNILNNQDLFIKIDIEGAEELINEDLKILKDMSNVTVYLSVHPPFMNNKNEYCDNLLSFCYDFNKVLDSSLKPLSKERLQEMILTDNQYPEWGTKFGNFFEIILSNKVI